MNRANSCVRAPATTIRAAINSRGRSSEVGGPGEFGFALHFSFSAAETEGFGKLGKVAEGFGKLCDDAGGDAACPKGKELESAADAALSNLRRVSAS